MKLASFRLGGRETWGRVDGNQVRPVADDIARSYPTLRTAIAADLFRAKSNDLFVETALDLDGVELLVPVPDCGKIICVGRNYLDHLNEMGAKAPDYPNLFVRFHDSLVPPGGKIVAPKLSEEFDFEGELCLVIGKGGRQISREDALSHIFGWSCFMDGSARDFQMKRSTIAGKNFEASGSFGPWIVTIDELPDPRAIELSTHLNGARVQHSSVSKMIFDIPEIIAQVSQFTRLSPGDVISTGTPDGVGMGRKPPLWMRPGDVVEVSLSGVGTLRNEIIAES